MGKLNEGIITVIICCYTIDRLEDIRAAIKSVMTQTCKPKEVIIVVDHNKELFNILSAEFEYPVNVVTNDGVRGTSETKSIGISSSTGEIIAFLDDDAVAAKDWLEQLASCYRDPQVIAAGGKAIPVWRDKKRPVWFPEELNWIVGCTHKGPPNKSREIRNLIGCNMSFRREAFDKAGVFNSKVGRVGKIQGAGEEAEICLRIKHAMPDNLIIYNPDAIIYHKVHSWRVTWKYLIQRSFDEGLSKYLVSKMFLKSANSPLSTENSYARYLLLTAIPMRFYSFYKNGNLPQALAMILSVVAAGAGYIKGKIKTIRMFNQKRVALLGE
jgi:O-antigen biosynthesis protein